MMIIAFVGSLILLFALHIKRRETPINFILLAAFVSKIFFAFSFITNIIIFVLLQTVVQAYSVGVIVTFYSKVVVLQALLLTLVVLAGLTIYTFQTKRDFSALYSG